MAEGYKVHEYTVETGPSGLPIARIGRIRPHTTYGFNGAEYYNWDGKWVNAACVEVSPDTIPDEIKRQHSLKEPPDLTGTVADVLVFCEFCPDQMPGKGYARHLADKHIRPGVRAAAPVVDVSAFEAGSEALDPDAEVPDRVHPAEIPPGNYVTDEEGYVLLNKDGTPKRKAGRPRKED